MKRDARFEGGKDGKTMFDFDLNGIECIHIYLITPDTKYESVWKCTLLLPPKLAEEMLSVGFNVKKKEVNGEMRDVIVAKRKTRTSDGKAMYPPKVYDAGTAESRPKPWPEDVAIGNGSVLNLKVSAIYRDVNNKTHLPLYLNAAQVVKHVPYNGSPFDSVDEDNSGFGSV